VAPVQLAPASALAPVVEQPPLAAGRSVLHFVFKRDAWLEVKDGSGRIIFAQMKARGSEQVLTGRPPFALVVGNAANVQLTYNDKPVDLMPHVKISVARLTLN
jgi:cytoskeleton protein RodZ